MTSESSHCDVCETGRGIPFGKGLVCKPCIRSQGLKRIYFAFLGGFEAQSPEINLLYAIVDRSVRDIRAVTIQYERDREQALRHLQGPIWEAQLVGVYPGWIRKTLRDYYLVDVTKSVKKAAL